MTRTMLSSSLSLLTLALLAACGGPAAPTGDPDTAPPRDVDRFSDNFGKLFKRSEPAFDPTNVQPLLPAPNAPIDFDTLFTVKALGPRGEAALYYALDILPEVPGRAFVFVDGAGARIDGQLPILENAPGEEGYNDFVQITEVTVGDGYLPNTITSSAALAAAVDAGEVTSAVTSRIENWSMVPKGSIATRTFLGARVDGERAWIDDEVASLLVFERDLEITGDGTVPTSGIVVIFQNDESPAQGFQADADGQTHNALETLPGEAGYSSLWAHQRGALVGFDDVTDFASALDNVAGPLPVNVNCPVVE